MGELGRGARLAEEPLAQFGIGRQRPGEDLDGHRPVEANVPGQVDHAHSAPTELALKGVLAGQQGLQRGE